MTNSAFNIREQLSKDTPFLFSWLSMAGASQAGQIARLPLVDGVALDLQHGMIDTGHAIDMIAAIIAAEKPAIVRTLWNDPGLVGQALDMGASAVIVPMVNSKAQAEALVQYSKYPPMGSRSWGGYQMVQAAGVTPGEYLQKANSQTVVFAMIETRAALDAVDEIASVKGIDGLFVGPSDLSIALSHGKGIDKSGPATIEAMKKVMAACKKNKLFAGAFAGSPDVANIYIDEGFTFIAAVTDGDLLRRGAAAALGSVKR